LTGGSINNQQQVNNQHDSLQMTHKNAVSLSSPECQGILFSGLTLDWFGSLPLCVYWSSL